MHNDLFVILNFPLIMPRNKNMLKCMKANKDVTYIITEVIHSVPLIKEAKTVM